MNPGLRYLLRRRILRRARKIHYSERLKNAASFPAFQGNGSQGFPREESKIEGKTSRGEDAEKIGTTAAQGTIICGVSTRLGKGAGIGAISGGAAGLIWMLAPRR